MNSPTCREDKEKCIEHRGNCSPNFNSWGDFGILIHPKYYLKYSTCLYKLRSTDSFARIQLKKRERETERDRVRDRERDRERHTQREREREVG